MSIAHAAAQRVRALRLGHRVRALRGAAGAVTAPRRLVLTELAMLPLRPVAAAAARLRGVPPEAAWVALTRPLGGLLTGYTLRDGGRRVHLRRGTPDVFTLYETHGSGLYEPPAPAARALEALGRPPRVLDLGANIGLFGLRALGRWPGAEVTSFEPDPANVAVLRRNAAADPDAAWEVVEAAAGARDGTMGFAHGHFAVSRAADGAGAATIEVAVRDALPHVAGCDLLKMDIEGGEWPILADPRLGASGAVAIVMEYHAWGAPSSDPAAAARDALRAHGYAVGPPQGEEAGSGTLWAWREPA